MPGAQTRLGPQYEAGKFARLGVICGLNSTLFRSYIVRSSTLKLRFRRAEISGNSKITHIFDGLRATPYILKRSTRFAKLLKIAEVMHILTAYGRRRIF